MATRVVRRLRPWSPCLTNTTICRCNKVLNLHVQATSTDSLVTSMMSRTLRPPMSVFPSSASLWRFFSTETSSTTVATTASQSQRTSAPPTGDDPNIIRLSKLISHYASNMTLSRRQAEQLIKGGHVTMYGEVVQSAWNLVNLKEIFGSTKSETRTKSPAPVFKVRGKPVLFVDELFSSLSNHWDGTTTSNLSSTRSVPHVWAVHKVAGEVVSERDPQGRPSLLDRLQSSGVGKIHVADKTKRTVHLKPIGRLDMMTEGLLLVTDDGVYAREMELPSNNVHRVYRARVHGQLTLHKLDQIRRGKVPIVNDSDNTDPSRVDFGGGQSRGGGGGGPYSRRTYAPMKVKVEKAKGNRRRSFATNTWLQITSTEGKNRQIRNVFSALGMTVTRLIRVQYGDYSLNTIPVGMAIPVPYKPLDRQKAVGKLRTRESTSTANESSAAITTSHQRRQQRFASEDKRTRNKAGKNQLHPHEDEEEASPVRWVTSIQ